jgi:hypothetical protein
MKWIKRKNGISLGKLRQLKLRYLFSQKYCHRNKIRRAFACIHHQLLSFKQLQKPLIDQAQTLKMHGTPGKNVSTHPNKGYLISPK